MSAIASGCASCWSLGYCAAVFVPPKPVRELRELTRRRRTLVRERSQEANRLHKGAGGDRDQARLRRLRHPRCVGQVDARPAARRRARSRGAGGTRERPPARQELRADRGVRGGSLRLPARAVDRGILRHIDFLDAEIAALGDAIETHLAAEREDDTRPFEPAVRLLCSLDGIQAGTAEMLLGEFGTDMSRSPSDAHFASWAAQCPGNHKSAGKRQSGKTRKAPKWLDGALHDGAMARSASRTATRP